MGEANVKILQFQPFTTFVDPSFWQELGRQKLEEHGLENPLLCIRAYFDAWHPTEKPSQASTHTKLHIPIQSGLEFTTNLGGRFCINGCLQNTGTIDQFKKCKKKALFDSVTNKIWEIIKSGDGLEEPAMVNQFFILCHANLKKFKYYYLAGCPALSPQDPFTASPMKPILDEFSEKEQRDIMDQYKKSFMGTHAFLLSMRSNSPELFPLTKLNQTQEEIFLAFWDPCSLPMHCSAILRNILFLVRYHRPSLRSIRILCLRAGTGASHRQELDLSRSRIMRVYFPEGDREAFKAVGWEKSVQGKVVPKVIDLAPAMDPTILANTAVDLNLKLMRWRALPEINLEKLRRTRCLLFGAGTLGCNVARCLMGWGVRSITFVDNGTVSYSNPVRQSLYGFSDCIESRPKALAAADQLKRIFPGMDPEGIVLSIPMPGHRVESESSTRDAVKQLEALIARHDVVYLLTDSRESRWLPTLLCNAQSKMVLNMALGFDSYLVMRHGIPSSPLGCYFCNDVVAPTDSITGRVLDQQCTITRPGVSFMASALGVELMVALLHHPDGALAPCSLPTAKDDDASTLDTKGHPLGPLPHQLRGSLATFSTLSLLGHRYGKCTACSEAVLSCYRRDGVAFIRQVVEDPGVLEAVTGLGALHAETLTGMMTWDDDEEDKFM